MTIESRVKVKIRCKLCGERFILKGRRDKGRVDTGFKMCVCSNDKEFDIETEDY
jgi:DNA-directed RNA polymerase subunit RPC12/RpoP